MLTGVEGSWGSSRRACWPLWGETVPRCGGLECGSWSPPAGSDQACPSLASDFPRGWPLASRLHMAQSQHSPHGLRCVEPREQNTAPCRPPPDRRFTPLSPGPGPHPQAWQPSPPWLLLLPGMPAPQMPRAHSLTPVSCLARPWGCRTAPGPPVSGLARRPHLRNGARPEPHPSHCRGPAWPLGVSSHLNRHPLCSPRSSRTLGTASTVWT